MDTTEIGFVPVTASELYKEGTVILVPHEVPHSVLQRTALQGKTSQVKIKVVFIEMKRGTHTIIQLISGLDYNIQGDLLVCS